MIDLHHDLLSILYYSYLRNDYQYVEKWISNFGKDNVSGLLANLYFMSPDEMRKEMGDTSIDVLEMFHISTQLFHKYLPFEKVVFSIEGCDYIKSEDELEVLYQLGLRNILLVWNHPNRYGCGVYGTYGLTDEGKKFLKKAIDLGICIDVSHMNQDTFYDTIDFIRQQQLLGKKVRVIASHSNCFEICSHVRNLDEKQLRALKSVGGLLGLVSYSVFVRDDDSPLDLDTLYLEHIEKAVSIMGIDYVGVSSDDMEFAKVLFEEDFGSMIFPYSEFQERLKKLLQKKFTKEEIDKILYQNVYRVFKEELK